MKAGFARVSTKDQTADLQVDALKKAGCTKVYTEVMSGAHAERPVLSNLLENLRTGDVHTLSRIFASRLSVNSRSARMGSPPFVGVWRVQTPSVSRRDSDPARACLPRSLGRSLLSGRWPESDCCTQGMYLKPFFRARIGICPTSAAILSCRRLPSG
jgi:Resolvase, N terminal domain